MQREPQAKGSLEQPQCNGSSEVTLSPVLPCPLSCPAQHPLVPKHPQELPWIAGGAGAVRFWGCLRSAHVPSLTARDDPISSWICWQGRSRPGVSQSPPLPRGGPQEGNLELMALLGTSPGLGQQVLNPGPGRKRKKDLQGLHSEVLAVQPLSPPWGRGEGRAVQPRGVWGCGGLGTDLLGRRGQEEPGGQGRCQQGWQEPDTALSQLWDNFWAHT